MDRRGLAVGAEGDSVTAERLTDAVVSALGDEQPHHLLEGDSVDVSAEGDSERLFPSVDAAAWLVATGSRVVVVVPRPVETTTEAVSYGAVESVEAVEGEFPELRVAAAERSLTFNACEGEPVGAAAAFVRERTRRDASPGTGSTAVNDVDRGSSSLADGPRADTPDRTDAPSEGDPLEQLERLADLHDRGVITEDELQERKQELLDRL